MRPVDPSVVVARLVGDECRVAVERVAMVCICVPPNAPARICIWIPRRAAQRRRAGRRGAGWPLLACGIASRDRAPAYSSCSWNAPGRGRGRGTSTSHERRTSSTWAPAEGATKRPSKLPARSVAFVARRRVAIVVVELDRSRAVIESGLDPWLPRGNHVAAVAS